MFQPANYGPMVEEILLSLDEGERLMPLAPIQPVEGRGLKLLRSATIESLFEDRAVESPSFAECVRSALFLYFSALDESHKISQEIDTPTGSLLHGIMHRQEPDYANAAYWFRRVGAHELFPTLREEALRMDLNSDEVRAEIAARPRWDPYWFIGRVEAAARGRTLDAERDLQRIQRLEWQLLFDYSYRMALSAMETAAR